MGTLVAKKYPTALFLNLADHTYVECGTGAVGWKCWGGKTGGTAFNSGTGSTKRANKIAGHKERAGITCYLINGVCHQAANRVLYPARKLVTGARGYAVSEALYGTYGRPRGFMFFCQAPFRKHSNVTGDLSECEESPVNGAGEESLPDTEDREYIDQVTQIYEKVPSQEFLEGMEMAPEQLQAEVEEFHSELFSLMMEYRLGSEFSTGKSAAHMLKHRSGTESKRFEIEESFSEGELDVDGFVEHINTEVLRFQTAAANTLSEQEYQALLALPRDEQVILGDLNIARQAYAGLNNADR